MKDEEIVFEDSFTRIWKYSGDMYKDHPFDLGIWIVWAPWMHMLWQYHHISLIHLRDVEGHPPAKMQFPEATHEFMVMSLNPDEPPDFERLCPLTPQSISQQLAAENDAKALEYIEVLIQRIGTHHISVDSDLRSFWKHLLIDHKLEDFKG